MTGARGSAAAGTAKAEKSKPERPMPDRPRSDKVRDGAREGGHRLVVPFEDNRLLPQLLGEHDAHLALLEERLGVDAHANGNIITLTGPQEGCETARAVLHTLYDRIGKGEGIGPGDVDGLIRHARSGAVKQDGMAQVRTRRRIVTARTVMQGT